MKIVTSAVDTIERIGINTDQAFTIKFDAKMAKILADGLYSDKVQSVIRELSCNAWDSHVEAGHADKPFEVHFPNTLEPWFSVKDFGVGLSHDQVISIYTCYGASTKTNSNAVIGQLGLGSKSPFSLCNAFDVSSRKDGVENHYSMYKDELGMPSVAHLGSVATTEPNGVTVKLPIRTDQRREFMDKAKEVYKWFPVKPRIIGGDGLNMEVIRYAYESKNWGIRGHKKDYYGYSYAKPVALMGLVAYPLDSSSIPNLTEAQRNLMNLPLVLRFDIGDLEVAANREALGYDDRTCVNIRARLEEVVTELGIRFERDISSAPTLWAARVKFDEIFGTDSAYNHEFRRTFQHQGLKWNNIVIKTSVASIDLVNIYDKTVSVNNVQMFNDRYKSGRYINDSDKIAINCVKSSVIIFNDVKHGGVSRVKEYYKVNKDNINDIWVFNESTKMSWDKIKNELGNPEVIMTSSLPKPVRIKGERTNILRWKGGDTNVMKGWDRVNIELDTGGYYVEMRGWNVLTDTNEETTDMPWVVKQAISAGIIPHDVTIYAMRSDMRSAVREDENWIELFGFVKAKTKELVVANNLAQMIADTEEYRKVTNHGKWQFWSHMHSIKNDESVMAKFCAEMNSVKTSINNLGPINEALRGMSQRFGIEIGTATPSVSLYSKYREVVAMYPMINFSSNSYSTPSGSDINNAIDYVNYVDICDPFYRIRNADNENND